MVGGHTVQGFVTTQVTWVVNLIGVPALAVLLWNVVAEHRHANRVRWVTLWASWGVMLVVQISLFVMHPVLNGMLDQQARSVLNTQRFDLVHEAYIKLTAVQHTAALVHLWFVLLVWSNLQPHGYPPSAPRS